jgi:glycosyltransferase involved in cell wall biosynthesis
MLPDQGPDPAPAVSLTEPEQLLRTLSARLAEQQQLVVELKMAAAGREHRMHDLARQAAEKEWRLEEMRGELARITGSRAWKLLCAGRALVRKLAPPRSWPHRLAQGVVRGLRICKREGLGALVRKGVRGLAARLFRSADAKPTLPATDPYAIWLAQNRWNGQALAAARARLEGLTRRPLLSVLLPVYNIEDKWLEKAVRSVRRQLYPNWELCIADDASTLPTVRPALARLAAEDSRIKVRYLADNGNISRATNAAAALASGEFLVFLDHDDELTPDCLLELALAADAESATDIIYSDNDKIDLQGRRYAPEFKPDWSPELLLAYMYFTHVFAIRRDLFERVSGFRPGFEGCQDYDLALRATEQARHIAHVPRILYHWRCLPSSTAATGAAKPEAFERGVQAVQEALARRDRRGHVSRPDFAVRGQLGIFQIDFPDEGPDVTILIPTRNQEDYLRRCIDSILARTTYRNYSIVIIDNESTDPGTLIYLKDLPPKCRVVRLPNADGRFNFARLNNEVAAQVTSEYVLFMNNDTEVRRPEWLSQLVGYAGATGVGAVGARLLYPDGRVQHAGVVIGLHHGLAGHAFKLMPETDLGCMAYAAVSRNYSAVTAACLLVRTSLFRETGGFDEQRFAVAYNDVDWCLRLRQRGLRCVYAPRAELIHHEGKSRGFADSPHERLAFHQTWGQHPDPYYNPNLSLDDESFTVRTRRQPAWVAPRRAPIKVLLCTHNLNQEGAPLFLAELAAGLQARGVVEPHLLSPFDGPLAGSYRKAGIPIHVRPHPLLGVETPADFTTAVDQLGAWMKEQGFQVVLANTLNAFHALHAAHRAGLPSLWSVHESVPWQSYFDQFRPAVVGPALQSFDLPYRIIFAAEATRALFTGASSRHNFSVIHYGLQRDAIDRFMELYSVREAKALIGCSPDKLVVTIVGTVCERKGQHDFARAAVELLRSGREDVTFVIVGCRPGPYLDELKVIARDYLADIHLVPEIDGGHIYFRASDIFICCSVNESFPRVILEAMAFRLPIVTTTVFGIAEQVIPGTSALTYQPKDWLNLSMHLKYLLDHAAERERLAQGAYASLETITSYAQMVTAYEDLLTEAHASVDPELLPDADIAAQVIHKQVA